MGKSRLLSEVRRRICGEAAWHEGHCLSFGRAMPFHPLVDLLRRQLEVGDGDTEAAIAAKGGRGPAAISPELAPAAPYLRALLSIDPGDAEVRAMTPAQRRAETVHAVRSLLGRGGEHRPEVLRG